jgi:hypothetical protein
MHIGDTWQSKFVLWGGMLLVLVSMISSGQVANIASVVWNGK